MTQRPPDDPERIAPVAHPDDCDCDGCTPACPGCGTPLKMLVAHERDRGHCDSCENERWKEQDWQANHE